MIKLDDKEFLYLVNYVKNNYGINLEKKRVLIEGRLHNYLVEKGFTSYRQYIKALEADSGGSELTNLLNRVTTNHTYFMREADHFTFLESSVLPILEHTVHSRDLRVWCACSSTGEEPYTLAMILQDYFTGKSPPWDKRLLATDISMKVLDIASRGVYSAQSVEILPKQWQKKYFSPFDKGQVQVIPALKKEVVFRPFNLMDPIVAKKPFHIIFCRNVMIYFDAPTKAALIERLFDALAPGGYLFVGHTESVSRPTRFEYVMPSVYRKP